MVVGKEAAHTPSLFRVRSSTPDATTCHPVSHLRLSFNLWSSRLHSHSFQTSTISCMNPLQNQSLLQWGGYVCSNRSREGGSYLNIHKKGRTKQVKEELIVQGVEHRQNRQFHPESAVEYDQRLHLQTPLTPSKSDPAHCKPAYRAYQKKAVEKYFPLCCYKNFGRVWMSETQMRRRKCKPTWFTTIRAS